MKKTPCLVIVLVFLCPWVHADDFVPFVIPTESAPDAPVSFSSPPIPPSADRLQAADGHFFHQGRRVRLWGVNLSFAANFPDKKDAPLVARRLARAGVNTVRCHHMDTANWPRGLWDPRNPTQIHPEALDRLDFFINELAKVGIYVDLNLHVGRAHSRHLGLPTPNTSYDKIVNLFTPALIDAQKDFARTILTHRNPYRGVTYAQDPAVAIVEITNENSLFMWSADRDLRELPEHYADLLQGLFCDWLARRYRTTDALAMAWNAHAEPLGENLLKNPDLRAPAPPATNIEGWTLEQHADCRARVLASSYKDRPAARIQIARVDGTDWHIQFHQRDLALKRDRYYTVSFDAAADQPRAIHVNVGMAHEPWSNLGLSQSVRLGPEWQSFRFGFVARSDDDNVRLSFVLGADTTTVHLANVRLQSGGQIGLAEGESLEKRNIHLFGDNEVAQRRRDRMIFLAETEKAFFDGMRRFIRDDLGCRALVTGTIVFGPLGLYGQSDMDFIDSHAYWQHPRFPNRPWDSNDWLIDQRPMVDHPQQATLFRMACERLADKPFTVTEYNHPAPLDSQAECVPLLTAFAAAQDWDGLWVYSYSHSNNTWGADAIQSFFDIHSNPAKWGFFPAGAVIFREAGIPPLPRARRVALARPDHLLPDLADLHLRHDRNLLAAFEQRENLRWRDLITTSVAAVLDRPAAVRRERNASSARLNWITSDAGGGAFTALGPQASVTIGSPDQIRALSEGDQVVHAPDFAAIVTVSLDGKAWADTRRILVTACGRCENTDMGFSDDRRTVGRRWGTGPVRIEAVSAELPVPDGHWTCTALRPDGGRGPNVPIHHVQGRNRLRLAPAHKTLWYLLEKNDGHTR